MYLISTTLSDYNPDACARVTCHDGSLHIAVCAV